MVDGPMEKEALMPRGVGSTREWANVGTFLVMTKLVPEQSTKCQSKVSRRASRGKESIPMAKLDVMASPRPMNLRRKSCHQRECPLARCRRGRRGREVHTFLLAS